MVRKSEVVMGFAAFSVMLLSSLLLIVLGLLYFIFTLWIVKVGSKFVGYPNLNDNWAVLSASIIAVGSIIGSALQRK